MHVLAFIHNVLDLKGGLTEWEFYGRHYLALWFLLWHSA